MLLPCAVMLAIALLPADLAGSFDHHAATRLVARATVHSGGGTLAAAITFALTILILAASLLRRRPTTRIARLATAAESAPFRALQILRSGRVADYVVWMTAGLAVLAGVLKFG